MSIYDYFDSEDPCIEFMANMLHCIWGITFSFFFLLVNHPLPTTLMPIDVLEFVTSIGNAISQRVMLPSWKS